MKLGMPTLIEYSSIQDNITLCKELGLDFIELNMNLPICLPESLSYEEIKKLRKLYGIDFTIHLPEEIDLSSFHNSIRVGHIERCKQAIEWAHAAGIKTLNMHLNNGIYFTLPHTKVWINEQYETRYLDLLLDSYTVLYDLSKKSSVDLCIENACNFNILFIKRALKKLKESFANFYLTWDVGHDAKVNYGEQEFIISHPHQVRHMHLHDYNGTSDHQPLYSGKVPIDDRLGFARNHNLTVVVEVKTSAALRESIGKLRESFK